MEEARVTNRLGDLRRQHGLTQPQIAKALGVNESRYKKWEYGKQYPIIDELVRIADYYGVGLDDIFPRDNMPGQKAVPEDVQAVVDLLMQLDGSGRAKVLAYTEGLVDSNAYKNVEMKED